MILTFVRSTGEIAMLKIIGRQVMFNIVQNGIAMTAPLEGLQLNPAGIVKEFPDLKGKPIPEIKKEALRRFKEKIKDFETQEQIKDYLQKDLEKHDYKLIMIAKPGHRPQRVK